MLSVDILKMSKNEGGRRAVPNQRACDFADPPTEEEGGGTPKKVTQCKRVKFGGRRADPTRQYNTTANRLYLAPYISRGHVPEVPRQRNVGFDFFIFGGGTVVSI